jgi:hypothetical protein
MSEANQRRRITRREAAKILHTSYENVRRLERAGQLHWKLDPDGVHILDRAEVEALARKRGLHLKPSGELTARVFKLFKARHSFADICIETEQDADTILALWSRYRAGFEYGSQQREEDEEARAQREHDAQMRELDDELERRRRMDDDLYRSHRGDATRTVYPRRSARDEVAPPSSR